MNNCNRRKPIFFVADVGHIGLEIFCWGAVTRVKLHSILCCQCNKSLLPWLGIVVNAEAFGPIGYNVKANLKLVHFLPSY